MWDAGRVDDAQADAVRDLRVCFAGDSYVAGVGDSSGLGWVGRLSAHAYASGLPITVYDLGVRGDTSLDVAARLPGEVARRTNPAAELRVVLAYGLNDVVLKDGRPRVAPGDSLAATTRSLAWLASAYIPAIFIGPPAIGDIGQDSRTEKLDRLLTECAVSHGVTYVSPFGCLINDPVWLDEVKAGDGAHPGPPGYRRYFEAVRGPLMRFLDAAPGTTRPLSHHPDPLTDKKAQYSR
jgi:acyl-CoA thioesterase I